MAGEPDPHLLFRNSVYNFLGQALPLAVALISIPYIVRGLGPERFGLLSLAWIILGYFTLFDLGLGRATAKYVAELSASGEKQRLPDVLWTSLACQFVFGVLGAALLFLMTPFLVERLLRIPQSLIGEARQTFLTLSLGVPVVLVSSSLSGALEGCQRFDLVNAVRIPANVGTYLLPALGVALGLDLHEITLLIVAWRTVATATLLWATNLAIDALFQPWPRGALLRRLLGFGTWVTVSSIVGPLLVYLERFLLATFVSSAAVGYYTAAYEAVTRLWILPVSLATSLYPVFSELSVRRQMELSGLLLIRSLRLLVGLLAPIVISLVVFGREIMSLWLGPDFAFHSGSVLQILALGVFVNSLAYIPYALLQACGRPDLTAKFHLLELPIHVVAATVLVRHFGLLGAAWAWTLRVVLDTALLMASAFHMTGWRAEGEAVGPLLLTGGVLGFAGIVVYFLKGVLLQEGVRPLTITALAVALVGFGYLVVVRVLLGRGDRELLRVLAARARPTPP